MTHGVIAPVQVDEAWQRMGVLANKVGKLLNWRLCWCFHKPTNEKWLGSDGWTLGEWLERSWLTSHLCKKCGVSDRQKKLVTARLLNYKLYDDALEEATRKTDGHVRLCFMSSLWPVDKLPLQWHLSNYLNTKIRPTYSASLHGMKMVARFVNVWKSRIKWPGIQFGTNLFSHWSHVMTKYVI